MPTAEPTTPQPDDTDTDTEPQLPPMDPVLEGLEDDPSVGLGDFDDDPNGMSFSAAGEDPLPGLDEAPFGDSDPEIGGFADAPFGVNDDDPVGGLGDDPLGADLAAPPAGLGSPPAGDSLEGTVIVQALAQLLVEKGLVGRQEFADRVRRLAARTPKG